MNFHGQNEEALQSERVREYYAEWTGRYMESFGDIFQSHRADDLHAFFEYFIASIGLMDGMNVLDAGCGIGGPAIQLASRLDIHIDAVNISPEQLQIAAEKIQHTPLRGTIKLVGGDFHDLHAATGKTAFYDVVYFMESLVHSNDPHKVLESVFKVLKPGGTIYIKDLYKRPAGNCIQKWLINRSVKINNRLFVLNILPKADILRHLTETGFERVFCRKMEINANQDIGNAFVVKNKLVKSTSQWYPYLEWYEIKCLKPA